MPPVSSVDVMGIVNVTPDSFSDGGKAFHVVDALDAAMNMHREGATWLDIGGESTRPGAKPVSVDEELNRVIPVIEAIRSRSDVLVSVDTSKPEVMLAAANAGANMINDVYALRRPGAMEAAASCKLPVCLMHMQGTPQTMQIKPKYSKVTEQVRDFLIDRMKACIEAGINKQNIVFDPGFGFGKTLQDNYQLLAHLDLFVQTGQRILVGMSRKSMIGMVTGREVNQRLAGGIALATLALKNGAHILRVHDVKETVDAVKVFSAYSSALDLHK